MGGAITKYSTSACECFPVKACPQELSSTWGAADVNPQDTHRVTAPRDVNGPKRKIREPHWRGPMRSSFRTEVCHTQSQLRAP